MTDRRAWWFGLLCLIPVLAGSNSAKAQLLDEQHSRPTSETTLTPEPAPQQRQGDLGTVQKGPDQLLSGPNRLTPPPTQAGTLAPPDPTGVWYHLKRSDLPAARAELKRLQAEQPDWTPPANLRQALAEAALQAAIADGDMAGVDRGLASLTGFDACSRPDIAWAVAALRHDRGKLLEMARQCDDNGIAAASIDRFIAAQPAADRPAVIQSLLLQPWRPTVQRRLDRALLDLDLAEVGSDASTLTASQLDAMTVHVVALEDPGASDSLGWGYLARQLPDRARARFADARRWSKGASGRTGLAIASVAIDDLPTALALLAEDQSLAPTLADALLARAQTRLTHGEPVAAVDEELRQAVRLGRGDAWETVGWDAIARSQAAEAATLFAAGGQREGALFGRVVAENQGGQPRQARDIACQAVALSARLRQACADALAEAELAAYRDGNYGETIRLADALAEVAPERSDALVLKAWSLLKDGQPANAAQLFAALYDRQPDPDLAGGLVESAVTAGDTDLLSARVLTGDTLLGAILAHRAASLALDRKQFLLAAQDPAAPATLSGSGNWAVGTGVELRQTEGDKGLGRMDILAPRLFAYTNIGSLRLGVTLVGADLRTGTAAADADLGGRPFADSTTPLTGSRVLLPIVSVTEELPDWTLSGRLSSTPLNGPIAPLPSGGVTVTHYGDPLSLSAQLFSQSVIGSLLSFSGLRDPVTGLDFGRVIEQGGTAQAILLPAERLSLALGLDGARLTGERVADNARGAARLDLAYDLHPDSLDHLRLGPFLSTLHFDRDLSHFTDGQGGYYSPRWDNRAGLLLDALTPEQQDWLLEGKASLSYSAVLEPPSLRFPLSTSLTDQFPAGSSHGLNADIALRGAILAGDHLMLSGFSRFSTAQSYNDLSLGLFLTLSLQPLQGVVSSDLPTSVLQPFH